MTCKLDQNHMRLALSLARKGEGSTSPNPMVGAVIVKSGKVISRGYHKKPGLPHAEIVALKKAGSKARGAHLFVNLEPCCHQGRTPPCTEAIIAAGIKKVVVGVRDPNHLVNGKGIRCLLKNGIEVVAGVLKKDCEDLNRSFLKYIRTRRPWVILKSALSLDGKIATRTGDSQWITSAKSRDYVHQLRSRVDAILVGAGTVRVDDPRLTVRFKNSGMRSPIRIIVDGQHTIPISARVFDNAYKERVIYATLSSLPLKRKNKLKKMGVEILFIKQNRGQVHLPQLMDKLGEMEITSVMVEGGSEISGNFFKDKLIDKLIYFIAPKIIGGKDALSPVGGKGIDKLTDALRIKDIKVSKVGDDLVIEGNI